jgi:hypothetical protein
MKWPTLKVSFFAIFFLVPFMATAQSQNPPAAAATSEQLLKSEELDALVAGIALYPDTLLSLVLMASTYPLEVVQADRWAKENKNLKGDQLKAAVDKQAWDDSVKSLVATPDVLSMMSTKLDWTQKLGDAVLAQQPDVMDAIQRLRTKAEANNKLTSTKEQRVTKKQEQGKQVIVIEPTEPNTVYVPYYDPAVVYGGWPYPAYPPYYFPSPAYIPGAVIGAGIAFGAGYALGRWASGGNYWGGGVGWGNNNINVNRPVNINNIGSGNNWQHNPTHRAGVKYGNTNVQQKFGNNNIRSGSQNRMDFRGQSGNQVLKPGGGGQANLGGNRPSAGGGAQRPAAGAGQRPGAGGGGGAQRPGGGQKPSTRPAGGGGGGNALGNMSSGRAAHAQSARGQASMGGRGGGGGGARAGGGGGARAGGGGGGGRGGGGGGGRGGGGGGGRRSDIALKHDVVLLGHLANGIGFYRFSYNGSEHAYVGVMAQDVQLTMPDAVTQGRDGYLRVYYDKVGVKFQTYEQWIASGARVPAGVPVSH